MRSSAWIVGLALLSPGALRATDGWTPLWNGKDFAGWNTWLGRPYRGVSAPGAARNENDPSVTAVGPDSDPLQVFSVAGVDGEPAIRISGRIFGGLITREEYGSYHLRLQFKWGVEKWPPREATPRDSGLLYHMHSPMDFNRRTWPRAIEFQIQERDVGDLYAIGMQVTVASRPLTGAPKPMRIYDPRGEPTLFLEKRPIGNRCVKGGDHEKPTGEWNTLDLVCLDDNSIHIVNGVVVMRLRHAQRLDRGEPAELASGNILLQSEGAEVFFRNIRIRPITAVPAEYADPAGGGQDRP